MWVQGNPTEIRELARYEVVLGISSTMLNAIHEFVAYVRNVEACVITPIPSVLI